MFLEHGADKLEDPLVALIIKRNYLCRVCMSQFFPSSRLDRNTCMGSIFIYFLQFIPSGCTGGACRGSIMACPAPVKSRDEPRSRDEIIAQAKDFLDQYYASIKR